MVEVVEVVNVPISKRGIAFKFIFNLLEVSDSSYSSSSSSSV